MNPDLTNLTQGEQLWLWRVRQPSPTGRRRGRGGRYMSAAEAADCFNYTVGAWCAAENDQNPDLAEVALVIIGASDPNIRQGLWLDTAALCRIARRRAALVADKRLTLMAELCEELGVTRPTFNKLESAGDPRVVALWQRRGFIFP